MIKKLLLAGLLACASLLPSNLENISATPTIPPSIPRQRIIQPPKYSDLLKFINPETKLPDDKYLADKPDCFESDMKGNYISKRYKFGNFDCLLYFAVEEMNYMEKENEIGIQLRKYPKYIKLELPMFFQKTYIDEEDGIDGKNEKEYAGENNEEDSSARPGNFYCIPAEGGDFPAFPEKGNELYPFLKNYLNEKGIPDNEFRTDQPVGMAFIEGRTHVLEDYFIDVKFNEKDKIADITACTLYFPVNDANFKSKKETDKIILKITSNPKYISLSQRRHNLDDNSIEKSKEFWFTDPNINGITGDELYDNEYPNMKKIKKSPGIFA